LALETSDRKRILWDPEFMNALSIGIPSTLLQEDLHFLWF
jgi:hypothetical protein